MDPQTASEYMREINEAESYLRGFFDDDRDAVMSPSRKTEGTGGRTGSQPAGAPSANTQRKAASARSAQASSPAAEHANGSNGAAHRTEDAYKAAREKTDEQAAREAEERKRAEAAAKAASATSATSAAQAKAPQAKAAKERGDGAKRAFKVAAFIAEHFPYRIAFFCIIVGYTLFTFGGLNYLPNITGVREANGYEFVTWYLFLCPLATLNLAIPVVTGPIKKLLVWIASIPLKTA